MITAAKVGRDVRKHLTSKHIVTHVTSLSEGRVTVLLVNDRYTKHVDQLLQNAGYITESKFERVDVIGQG